LFQPNSYTAGIHPVYRYVSRLHFFIQRRLSCYHLALAIAYLQSKEIICFTIYKWLRRFCTATNCISTLYFLRIFMLTKFKLPEMKVIVVVSCTVCTFYFSPVHENTPAISIQSHTTAQLLLDRLRPL